MANFSGVSVMSGYREQSNYDPYASPRYGKPLRPYNWVQWSGVAMVLAGVTLELAFLAQQAGWIRKLIDSPMIGSSLVLLAVPLINSRREELPDPAPELAAARKRWMLMTVVVCAFILGTAAAIEFARS
jgi:hypothetical protein